MTAPSLILMGSKPGAVVALEIALSQGWHVPAVVVSKEEPHPWLPADKLQDAARDAGIPIFTQKTLPAELRADLVVSYMYRNRVTRQTLDRAGLAALNFHAAPLPEYGGWAFYSAAILENATSYGCTCHHMDEGFDTGPLCIVRRFPIDAEQETAVSLERRAQAEMIDLFADVVARVQRGEPLPCTPQDESRQRYMTREAFMALKRIPEDAEAEAVERIARAFWYPPYDCAYIEHNGNRVEVVPQAAKLATADALHRDDLSMLRAVAQEGMASHGLPSSVLRAAKA